MKPLENIQHYKIVLASNSPRRRELLSGLNLEYTVRVLPDIDESYPDTLKGEEIPLSARIIALADTYDAMTSTRSYRKALEHMEAINEIERCKGSQFDPELAQKFIDMQDLILQAKENPEEFYAKYSVLQKKVAENIHNM